MRRGGFKMKRIAFIKFAGLAAGGCEKYLQNIACILSKSDEFEVDYFYTNASPYINWDSPFVHPDNDESRKKIMQEHDIKLIKVNVENKDAAGVPYRWVNTDFWELFNEEDYDYVSSARSGYPEYPFNLINKTKIIDTIHGPQGEDKENIEKSILLCDWQAEQWANNGGNIDKAIIIPTLVKVPEQKPSNLREELGISPEAFVYGFHQGNRDDIYSPLSLAAYEKIANPNNYFIIMGGSQYHRQYAKKIGAGNILFLDFESSVEKIHNFLGAIDVFAHARRDGEVCSAAIIEALYHGKPIISHPAMNMGHAEQIEGCGKMATTLEEYFSEMKKLEEDNHYYADISSKAKAKYEEKYSYNAIQDKILKVYSDDYK